MVRVFRFVYVSTLCLIAAMGFERAWSHETPPYYVDPEVTAQIQPGTIQFRPCAEDASLQCGRLTLPVDYRKPHGETFSMGVIRAATTRPARRIGVLLQNPGTPGESGVDLVLGSARTAVFERLRERFDVLSFDPRGVARSREVFCWTGPRTVPVQSSEEALSAFFDELGRDVAQACLDQNGPFVASLSSNNIARDMDALRRALGERQISLIGPSYGSRIGAVYASLFPDHVRAMVLDGAVPPEHRDNLVEFASQAAIAEELALTRLDARCREDPECPLHATGVIEALGTVTGRLKTRPIVTPDGRVLTDTLVKVRIGKLLSFELEWPRIVQLLAAALEEDFAPLLAAARTPSVPLLARDNIIDATLFDAFTAVTCNDFGTRRPSEEYLPVDEAVGVMTPNFHDRFVVAPAAAMCSAWPAADLPVIRDVSHRVEHPILIIGVDFDSASPLSWSRSLAHALGMESSLIRYQGSGHTAFPTANSICIDLAVEAYLFDLAIPAAGTRCPAQPIHF